MEIDRPAPPPHSLAYLYPMMFLSGTILISLGPVLDPIIRDLHLPLAQGGVLAAGYSAGRVVGLIVLNVWLARLSLKALVVASALIQALGLALPALFAHSLGPLVAALAVVGAAVTVPVVVPVVWIAAYAKQTTERALLLVFTFFSLGVVVAPLAIGAALVLGAGWRWVFGAGAAFALLFAFAMMALPLADVPGRENLRLHHMKEALRPNPRLLVTMLVAMFFYIGAESTLNIWVSEYQVDTFGVKQGVAAVALALFWSGMMAGRYLAVPLTRRLASRSILAVSCAAMAVFALLTALAPTFPLAEAGVFLTGLAGSAAYPMLSSYISRFPSLDAGLLYSIITFVVIVSGAVFGYVAGPIGAAMGMRMAIGLAAVPALAVLVFSFLLPTSAPRPEV